MSAGEIKLEKAGAQEAVDNLSTQSREISDAQDRLQAAFDLLTGSSAKGETPAAAASAIGQLLKVNAQLFNCSSKDCEILSSGVQVLIDTDKGAAASIGGGDGA